MPPPEEPTVMDLLERAKLGIGPKVDARLPERMTPYAPGMTPSWREAALREMPAPATNSPRPGAELVRLPAPIEPGPSAMRPMSTGSARGELVGGNGLEQSFDVTGGLTPALSRLASRPMPVDPAALGGMPGAEPIVTPRPTRLQPVNPVANPSTDPMVESINGTMAPKNDTPAPTLQDMLTAQEEYDLAPKQDVGKWAKILYGIGEVAEGVRSGIEGRAYTPSESPMDRQRAERERGIAELQRNRDMKWQREERELDTADKRARIAKSMADAQKALREPPVKGNFSSRGSTEDLFVAVTDQNTGTVDWQPNPNYSGPKVKFDGKDVWTSDEYGTEFLNTITVVDGKPVLTPVLGADGKPATRKLKPADDGGPTTADQRYADEKAIEDYLGSPEGQKKRQYHIGNAQAERLRAIDPNLTIPGLDKTVTDLRAAAAEQPPEGAGYDKEVKLQYEQRVQRAKDTLAAIQKALDDGAKEGDEAFKSYAKSRGRRGPSGRSGTWGDVNPYSE